METSYRVIVAPGRTEKNYWSDLWHFRELFYILSWRDVKVRYKQTAIGVAWAVLRPLLTMVILTVVFGKVAGMKLESSAPYAIMVFAGLLPWQFFSSALTGASESLITNSNLLSKVYFPRLIVPASAIITSFVDFLISFVILVGLMAYYGYPPTWRVLVLPFFTLLAFLQAFGFGLYLATLNVKYRDFRYVIPFIVQVGMYVAPIGFSSSAIPDRWRPLYNANPVVAVIDGFRWSIIGQSWSASSSVYLTVSVVFTLSVLGYALHRFRAMEQTFADTI